MSTTEKEGRSSLDPVIYDPNLVDTIPRKTKLIHTITVYFCFFIFANGYMILTPTLLSLQHKFGGTDAEAAFGVTVRFIAYGTGCLGFGTAFSYLNRQVLHITFMFVVSIILFAMPWIQNYMQYILINIAFGMSMSCVDVASNSWILDLWQTGANPYMQCLHLMFAIGAASVATIAKPFLPTKKENNTDITYDDHLSKSDGLSLDPDSHSLIYIPYSIIGCMFIVGGIVMATVVYNFPVKKGREETVEGDLKVKSTSYRYIFVIGGACLLTFYSGSEINSATFVAEFVVYHLNVSEQVAANFNMVLAYCFMGSRIIAVLVAMKVQPSVMLLFNLSLLIAGNCVLLFGGTSDLPVYIGLGMIGLGISCVFPGIMSFLEQRIDVTYAVCGIFQCATCTGMMVIPQIEGKYIATEPIVFVIINLVGLVVGASLFLSLLGTDWISFNSQKFNDLQNVKKDSISINGTSDLSPILVT